MKIKENGAEMDVMKERNRIRPILDSLRQVALCVSVKNDRGKKLRPGDYRPLESWSQIKLKADGCCCLELVKHRGGRGSSILVQDKGCDHTKDRREKAGDPEHGYR